MPIARVGPLNRENVRGLNRRLQQDEGLRSEAIGGMRRNIYAFVETAFDLTKDQRQEMRDLVPQAVAEAVGAACIMALQHRQEIDFQVVRGQPERKIKVEFSFPSTTTTTIVIQK